MKPKILAKSLNEIAQFKRGEKQLKTVQVTAPSVDVRKIRASLALSQAEFASRFCFSVGTIRNWEQRTREPEAAARVLLTLIERNPDWMEKELKKVHKLQVAL